MPVSDLLSGIFGGGPKTELAERILVWAHLLLVLGFLVYLPGSKHLHIMTAAPNVWLAKTGPSGRLEPLELDLEGPEEDLRFGAATAADLSRKQVLDLFSCTECGRCQEVCPAWSTGKPLSPKLLIMELRDHVAANAPAVLAAGGDGGVVELQPLVPAAVEDEIVWDCVTCGACVRECPVDIEHVDTIVDLRRHLVMAESRFPLGGRRDAPRRRGPGENPWGQPQSARIDWAEGLEDPRAATRRPGARVPVLGRVRRGLRRACAGSHTVDRTAAVRYRHRLRGARPARALHRRPGPPDGPRVPVPDARRAERRDPERARA